MTKTELRDIRKEVDVVFARLEANLDTPKVNTTNTKTTADKSLIVICTIIWIIGFIVAAMIIFKDLAPLIIQGLKEQTIN